MVNRRIDLLRISAECLHSAATYVRPDTRDLAGKLVSLPSGRWYTKSLVMSIAHYIFDGQVNQDFPLRGPPVRLLGESVRCTMTWTLASCAPSQRANSFAAKSTAHLRNSAMNFHETLPSPRSVPAATCGSWVNRVDVSTRLSIVYAIYSESGSLYGLLTVQASRSPLLPGINGTGYTMRLTILPHTSRYLRYGLNGKNATHF